MAYDLTMKSSKFMQHILVLVVGVMLGVFLGVFSSQIFSKERIVNTEKICEFNPSANYSIVIDKTNLQLTLLVEGELCKRYLISDGANNGNKQEIGDCRTPIGEFKIVSIEDSTTWSYDFDDDDFGAIIGAYGPYFLRLQTPWKGIGIHGTHDEQTIGFHNSHGCIRLKNEDIVDLRRYVTLNTVVKIIP